MSLRASSRSMRSAPLTAGVSGLRPHLTAAALMRWTAAVVMTSTAATSAMSRTASLVVSGSDMGEILPCPPGTPPHGAREACGVRDRTGGGPRTPGRSVAQGRLGRGGPGVVLGDPVAENLAETGVDVRPVPEERLLDAVDRQGAVLPDERVLEA